MSQIFISHVEEDESIALEIARGLEAAGHSTWYYERDSLPGLSYLDQIDEAIEQCQAVIVIISLASLSSWQVDKEVERAHESGKHFVPVLRGVKHLEFQTRKRGWRMAMGVSTSISVPADGASTIVPRIVAGLRRLVINSEEPILSPPVSDQTAAPADSFSEPTDHSVETGEARFLQSEGVAEQPLVDTTPTVSDADTDAAPVESAKQCAVEVPVSREPVATRTHRTIPGIPALLRRVKARTAMVVLGVLAGLVFLEVTFYDQSKPRERGSISEEAAQSKKTDPASSLTGTTWRRTNMAGEIVFQQNGIFQYNSTTDDRVYFSGHWWQNGSSVKFNIGNGIGNVYFDIVISPEGNEMKGTTREGPLESVTSVLFTKVP